MLGKKSVQLCCCLIFARTKRLKWRNKRNWHRTRETKQQQQHSLIRVRWVRTFVAESLCRINCLSGRFSAFSIEWAALHFSLTANKEGDRTIEVFAWKFSYSPNIGKNNIGIELGMEVEDVYWCKIYSRLIWSNGPTTTTTRYHMNKNKQHGQSKPCLMVNCTFQLYTGSIQLHFSIHKTDRERVIEKEKERKRADNDRRATATPLKNNKISLESVIKERKLLSIWVVGWFECNKSHTGLWTDRINGWKM